MVDQTPRPNFDDIATAGDGEDITAGWVDELRQPRDEILRTRGRGDLTIYERLKRDDQVQSCFQQRVNAVVSREWTVEPGGTKRIDKKAAEFVEEQLRRIRWDNVTKKMLNGVFYGYGVAECMWAAEGGQIVLDAVRVRRAARFRFGKDGTLRLMAKDHPEGLVMPERKFWTFSAGADDDDDPYGRGLGYFLYWPVWFKRNGLKFWAVFIEKFAAPTAKGVVPPGSTEDERGKLLQALRAITQDSALVVPEGTMVELLQAVKSSGGDYAEFYRLMDAAIAKVVLSQTMTTDNGSSQSQAEVHADVKMEVVKADADLICESFADQVVRWLIDWNFPGAAYPSVWRDVSEPEDMKARADRDKVLFDMGFQPTPEYIAETYGEGFVPKTAPAPAAGEDAAPPAPAEASFAEGQRDQLDDLAEQLDQVAAPAVDSWLNDIRRVLETSATIPQAIERLEALYPDMALDDLAAAMGEAMLVADLSGRAEALDA